MPKRGLEYQAGGGWIALGVAILGVALIATASPARADVFTFTSCHVTGGCGTATSFGTVTLTQAGTSVLFDVVLSGGNRFVETGAGGNALFLFNDDLSGSTITNIVATLNGAAVAIPGGLSGFTNTSVLADGTGTFTAAVECNSALICNGVSTPIINDLHFAVTNATIAEMETANANGNIFVADILFTSGLTGPVDVSASASVPEPATLALFGVGLAGLAFSRRPKLN